MMAADAYMETGRKLMIEYVFMRVCVDLDRGIEEWERGGVGGGRGGGQGTCGDYVNLHFTFFHLLHFTHLFLHLMYKHRYCLLRGVNDGEETAHELGRLLQGVCLACYPFSFAYCAFPSIAFHRNWVAFLRHTNFTFSTFLPATLFFSFSISAFCVGPLLSVCYIGFLFSVLCPLSSALRSLPVARSWYHRHLMFLINMNLAPPSKESRASFEPKPPLVRQALYGQLDPLQPH
jgi:hypothetical protein